MLKKILSIFVLSCFLSPIANAFDYAQCEKRALPLGFDEVSKCKHSEMLIEQKKLQDLYDVLANDSEIKVLNKNDMKRMYDSWLFYRNSYCDMYTAAVTDSFSEKYNKEHCLLEHTRNARLYMQALIDNFYTDPD
ncbi:MAG: hypothetical protein LBR70_05015 [Lactobacillaceae bacterium]|jgi:uncharacterized protein YecT (DUF1311 family)|nr:hypothetical protein [Lactobacillaceae bacterium]